MKIDKDSLEEILRGVKTDLLHELNHVKYTDRSQDECYDDVCNAIIKTLDRYLQTHF